jgi:hypothetical protein
MDPGSWTRLTGAILTNGEYTVTLPPATQAQFFRLTK